MHFYCCCALDDLPINNNEKMHSRTIATVAHQIAFFYGFFMDDKVHLNSMSLGFSTLATEINPFHARLITLIK